MVHLPSFYYFYEKSPQFLKLSLFYNQFVWQNFLFSKSSNSPFLREKKKWWSWSTYVHMFRHMTEEVFVKVANQLVDESSSLYRVWFRPIPSGLRGRRTWRGGLLVVRRKAVARRARYVFAIWIAISCICQVYFTYFKVYLKRVNVREGRKEEEPLSFLAAPRASSSFYLVGGLGRRRKDTTQEVIIILKLFSRKNRLKTSWHE